MFPLDMQPYIIYSFNEHDDLTLLQEIDKNDYNELKFFLFSYMIPPSDLIEPL